MSEFTGWVQYLRVELERKRAAAKAEWETPTPLIWYVIRLTQEVIKCQLIFGGGSVPSLNDLVLPFTTTKQEKTEAKSAVPTPEEAANKMAISKAVWGAMAQFSNGRR